MNMTRAERQWQARRLPGSIGDVLLGMRSAIVKLGWTTGVEMRPSGEMCLVGAAKYVTARRTDVPSDAATMMLNLALQHLAEILGRQGFAWETTCPAWALTPDQAQATVIAYNDKHASGSWAIDQLLKAALDAVESKPSLFFEPLDDVAFIDLMHLTMRAWLQANGGPVRIVEAHEPPPALIASAEAAADEVIAEVLATQDRELVPA